MTFGHSDGRDKGTLQHSRKCFPGLLYRSPETLETVCWRRRKLFRRRSLASECKYTIIISMPPVSELPAHKLYFHHPACPEIRALGTPSRDSLMNIARKLSAIKFRPTRNFSGKSDWSWMGCGNTVLILHNPIFLKYMRQWKIRWDVFARMFKMESIVCCSCRP